MRTHVGSANCLLVDSGNSLGGNEYIMSVAIPRVEMYPNCFHINGSICVLCHATLHAVTMWLDRQLWALGMLKSGSSFILC